MSDLTSLERDVLRVIFSSFLKENRVVEMILNDVKIEKRSFSAEENGYCSGFYTHFFNNSALAGLDEVPSEFSVHAKHDQLSAGEMGFFVFCDVGTRSLKVIEGFFYGDDRLAVEEILREQHSFIVYGTPGL